MRFPSFVPVLFCMLAVAGAFAARSYQFAPDAPFAARCAHAGISGAFTFTKAADSNLYWARFAGGAKVAFFADGNNVYRFSVMGDLSITSLADFNRGVFRHEKYSRTEAIHCEGRFR